MQMDMVYARKGRQMKTESKLSHSWFLVVHFIIQTSQNLLSVSSH